MRVFPITSCILICLGAVLGSFGSFAQSSIDTRTLAGPLLDQALVKPGQTVPDDLVVYTESGEQRSLRAVATGKFTVLVSGCLTCPIFHRTYPSVEAVYEDYKNKDELQFFYLYKSLAHPEYNGYIQPLTLEERLAQIVEAKRVLDTSLTWLCDGMDNAVRHTLGFGPNTQMILDPDGKIIHALGWSDGDVLRKELVKWVGDSETHTQVSDLTIKKQLPANSSKSVQSLMLTKPVFKTTLVPVIISAKDSGKQLLYVKPRIEVEPSVLQHGRGEMYLGFHLDPIHHVHWNNLAAPLQFEINPGEGVYMTPKKAEAEKVEADSDAAPREFAIEITTADPGATFDLTFHYFACSDEEGWCLPVTQKYQVTLAADPDGGGTMGRSFNNGGGRQGTVAQGRAGPGGGRQQGGPPRGQSPEQMKTRIMQSDGDGDGKISESEAPVQMQRQFARADLDQDGLLSEEEVDQFLASRPAGPASRPPVPGGPGGPGSGRPGQRGNPAAQLMDFDANGDGKISLDELPQQMRERFGRMDENGDGVIDQMEVDAMAGRFREGQEPQQRRRAQPPGRPVRDSI